MNAWIAIAPVTMPKIMQVVIVAMSKGVEATARSEAIVKSGMSAGELGKNIAAVGNERAATNAQENAIVEACFS